MYASASPTRRYPTRASGRPREGELRRSGCGRAGEYAARLFIPKSEKPYRPDSLERGLDNFLSFGCYGCHKIDEAVYPVMKGVRPKVGPQLDTIARKTSREWLQKWVWNPKDFRPDTRMPRFFGLSNNSHSFKLRFSKQGEDDVDGIAWSKAEAYALVEWLLDASGKEPYPAVDLTGADPARGERILVGDYTASAGQAKACIACHEAPVRTRNSPTTPGPWAPGTTRAPSASTAGSTAWRGARGPISTASAAR
ncbi:MAG: hypothetical protein HC813_01330 [Planctomycetes bacterium]|nr:hypothetical protein [Planctomycetota bacterium]